MAVSRQPAATKTWMRLLLVIAGTVFLGLGIIGIFVPVLPTTPFLLLAAACYARSSQRLYGWLLNNRWFGKYISNYLQGRGIPLRIKISATCVLWLTIGVSVVFVTDLLIIRIALVIIAG